jgi:hypothetical protein
MKLITYTYKKGDVNLSFNFPDDEKLEQNKKDFVELLKEALKELE